MRLARYSTDDGVRLAAVVGDEIVDLAETAPELPGTMIELLAAGAPALALVRQAVDGGQGRRPLELQKLLAPVEHPEKFIGIGLNYADHIAETGLPKPEFPTVFAMFASCITGPYADIERPLASDKLDYEGELVLVIGKTARHVAREDAADVIAGYLVTNDVSVRDWQRRSGQWTLGKSFDTHGPIGPWIVTSDEVPDPHDLAIRTLVNAEVRQQSNTSNLIFDCYDLVATISAACTLRPGDLIATGTPGGVGHAAKPPRLLAPGDVVRVEVDGIGVIENRVVAEQPNVSVATSNDTAPKDMEIAR